MPAKGQTTSFCEIKKSLRVESRRGVFKVSGLDSQMKGGASRLIRFEKGLTNSHFSLSKVEKKKVCSVDKPVSIFKSITTMVEPSSPPSHGAGQFGKTKLNICC